MKKTLIFGLILSNAISYSQSALYGTTYNGGSDDLGTIFRTDLDGTNHQMMSSFNTIYPGSEPKTNMVEVFPDIFIGTTSTGGANGFGCIYEFNFLTGEYINRFDFDGNNGDQPYGDLLLASNGLVYGTTRYGGANGAGTLFAYDPVNHSHDIWHDFDFGLSDGQYPHGGVIEENNALYGTLQSGGANGNGAIFKKDLILQGYGLEYSFDGVNGRDPISIFTKAANGLFYGVAPFGGVNDQGVFYTYDIGTQTLTKLVDFGSSPSVLGAYPKGSPTIVGNKVIGMTTSNGANGFGAVYQYIIGPNTMNTVHMFNGLDGAGDRWSFVENGTLLYGTSEYGGAAGKGTVFSFDPSTSALNVIHEMSEAEFPLANLTITSVGSLLGTSYATSFMFNVDTLNMTYQNLFPFEQNNGEAPGGNLLFYQDSLLLGVSESGGFYSEGTIFSFNINTNEIITLFDFTDTLGSSPGGELVLASDGLLYGTTSEGGDNDDGVLYSYDFQNNSYAVEFHFDAADGYYPISELVELNQNLYGVCQLGGANNDGSLFSYNIAVNSMSFVHDFNAPSGENPSCGLTVRGNNLLLGTARSGGQNNDGVIFSFDTGSDNYTVLHEFDISLGKNPQGSMLHVIGDKLYGITSQGGNDSYGVLYEYDLATSSYSVLYHMNSNDGGFVLGNLIQGENGELMGLANQGGLNNSGTIFSFNVSTLSFTKHHDFLNSDGSYPGAGLTNTCFSEPNVSLTDGVFTTDLNNASYQWLDCLSGNTPIPGATSQTFEPTMNGNYAVEITYQGCTRVSECLSIQDVSLNSYGDEIKVYPNPFEDVIFIANSYTEIEKISVFDIYGRIVFIETNFNDQSFYLGDLEPGIYLLMINNQNGSTYSKKILKN